MSANTNGNKVCGLCQKMARYTHNQRAGECYHGPPVVHPSGFTLRPKVGEHDRACSFYEPSAVASMTAVDMKLEAPGIVQHAVDSGAVKMSTAPPAKWAPKGKRG